MACKYSAYLLSGLSQNKLLTPVLENFKNIMNWVEEQQVTSQSATGNTWSREEKEGGRHDFPHSLQVNKLPDKQQLWNCYKDWS